MNVQYCPEAETERVANDINEPCTGLVKSPCCGDDNYACSNAA
jgi:hypothetical protein